MTSWWDVLEAVLWILWLGCALLLIAPVFAHAQAFGPAHHVVAFAGPGTGAQNFRDAFNRRLLGLINDSANAVYCTVDGTNAAANTGLLLAASGTTGDRILFDRQVPQGPLRCYSATAASRVLITEGR